MASPGERAIPASVRDAVNARQNRLAPAEREFLETISLIPGTTPEPLLRILFGDAGETLGMARAMSWAQRLKRVFAIDIDKSAGLPICTAAGRPNGRAQGCAR
ncbi:MAG: hypothetical protein U5K76_12295 [Woeseiaceae bacterium]|nr:hypothetical protein [Woeseiaceae bacterium]